MIEVSSPKVAKMVDPLGEWDVTRLGNAWERNSGSNLTQKEERELAEAFRQKLPNLVDCYRQYPPRFRLPLALAMCLIDSRTLEVKIKTEMGVCLRESTETVNLPRLVRPSEFPWKYPQCLDSEAYLEDCRRARAGEVDQTWTNVTFFLAGCLEAKRGGRDLALCTETTEFINGAIFIEGVWYEPRDVRVWRMIERFDPQRPQAIRQILAGLGIKIGSDSTEGLDFRNHVLTWRNAGGLWQPMRGLNQPGGYEFILDLL